MASLPYLARPGSVKTAFEKIKAAATPERVTSDFVSTKLQMKGGTGTAIPPFLKKIGFVAPDGSPTELYKRFRNASSSRAAVADAIKLGYKELASANEYFFELSDKDLQSLIVQVTGAEAESGTAKLTFYTLKNLKAYADFEASPAQERMEVSGDNEAAIVRRDPIPLRNEANQVGLNLSYTINLNLPATADQAVFNAIFRSLKEHLLSNDE